MRSAPPSPPSGLTIPVYRIMRFVLDLWIALCDSKWVKEIEFTSAAIRQWRKLTATTRAQIGLKLKAFAKTGIGNVKALKGAAGMRLRSGYWRALCTIK